MNDKQTGTRIWHKRIDHTYTIGYCCEEPAEVLRRLVSGYALLSYRGAQLLADPVKDHCDLYISGFSEADRIIDGYADHNPHKGTSITGTIDDLLPELSEMRRRKNLSSEEVAQVLKYAVHSHEVYAMSGLKMTPEGFKSWNSQFHPWYDDLKKLLRELEK